MSIAGLLVRFLIYYPLAAIAIAIIVELLKIHTFTTFGIVLLFGLSALLAESYGKKNGRYFNRSEKRAAILGMAGISIAYQLLIVGLTNKYDNLSVGAFILIAGIGSILSVLIIAAGIDIVGKNLVKRGIVKNDKEGCISNEKQNSKNPFLRSVLKIITITAVLIIVVFISIPIVGELMK